jgi:hypothetical protein
MQFTVKLSLLSTAANNCLTSEESVSRILGFTCFNKLASAISRRTIKIVQDAINKLKIIISLFCSDICSADAMSGFISQPIQIEDRCLNFFRNQNHLQPERWPFVWQTAAADICQKELTRIHLSLCRIVRASVVLVAQKLSSTAAVGTLLAIATNSCPTDLPGVDTAAGNSGNFRQ